MTKANIFTTTIPKSIYYNQGYDNVTSEDKTACKHENVTVVYGITYCDDCHLTLYKGGEEE